MIGINPAAARRRFNSGEARGRDFAIFAFYWQEGISERSQLTRLQQSAAQGAH
jgi:hypothetical protein